ncbi:MAG: DUF937 domain-containing protein, partial [bacterium]|nr:DUF937 domain-containing protein [bacterium]
MSSILDQVMKQLDGDQMKQIGGLLGVDTGKAEAATGTAISALLGGLSRNAANPNKAEALSQALAKDHDGSVLDGLQSAVSHLGQDSGDGILRHVFGDKRGRVESGVSQASGLDKSASRKLMAMVAPLVMGALGKKQRDEGADPRGLASMLAGERQELERSRPEAAGIVTRLLDTDGDNDMDLSDVLSHGRKM